MIYFKRILFTVLNLLIVFFQCTAFGLYSSTSDSIESEINVNFETQTFFKANLNETYTPVLLFNDNEGYCVIPLSEQDLKRLNTQEILKQNTLENSFAFEQMKDLKPCQPEIAQVVLDSIDKKANQLAIVQTVVVAAAAVIYVGACATADHHVTNKRAEATDDYVSPVIFGGMTQATVGIVCSPIYALVL